MRGKIRIDIELCKGCTYCVDACPAGVLGIGSRFNNSGFFPAVILLAEKCSGCALCARVCPEIAIEVYQFEDNEVPQKG